MNWQLFASAFIFIFLASLPGRTTFLMIIMSTHTEAKKVIVGAGLAFAIQCAISVVIGNALSFVSKDLLHILVGLLFIYFGYHFWRASRRSEPALDGKSEMTVRNVFSIVFAGEWGDVSQIAIASYSAEHVERVTIFSAGLLALWSIVVISVCVGRIVRHALKPKYIQLLAAIGFVCVGTYLIFKSLF